MLFFVAMKAPCGQSSIRIASAIPKSTYFGPVMTGETQIAQKPEQSLERRRAIRYRMSTSVIFRWKRPDNQRFQAEGVTRDMSVEGVFVLTGTPPPVNAVIQMEVILPLSDGASKARMKSEMKVLRVDHD